MIKFFRQIRQTIIMENNKASRPATPAGRYFKYAVGEIILVVIGILIALQINNWNEKRKQEDKTQNYYRQLLEDLHKDKVFVNQTIAKFEDQRKAYNDYLKTFNESSLTKEEMHRALLQLNSESYALDFNTSTIQALQNRGERGVIPPRLRNKLVDLKRQQEKIARDESLDNRGKTGVAERLSMLMGASSLGQRLSKQPELRASLGIDNNQNDIILGLEAMQDWMHFSESKSIRLLKELLEEIKILEGLIKVKLKE